MSENKYLSLVVAVAGAVLLAAALAMPEAAAIVRVLAAMMAVGAGAFVAIFWRF